MSAGQSSESNCTGVMKTPDRESLEIERVAGPLGCLGDWGWPSDVEGSILAWLRCVLGFPLLPRRMKPEVMIVGEGAGLRLTKKLYIWAHLGCTGYSRRARLYEEKFSKMSRIL